MNVRFAVLLLLFACSSMAIAPAVFAEAQITQPGDRPDIQAFSRSLKIAEVLDVIRAEGIDQSSELSESLFPGENEAAWAAVVSMIYDPVKMKNRFDAALAKAVAADAKSLAAAQVFFGSDLGQRVMTLEISARRSLLDDDAEAAAAQVWDGLAADKTPRAEQIIRFGALNDLIESNVMGALNANLAFYRGLSGAGGFGDPMPENEMLAEVWGQEAEIRAETTEWLYPFLALAYQPLSDADLDRYIAFSETEAGKNINAAIFAAFDEVMTQVSSDLGTAAGRLMAGQDI